MRLKFHLFSVFLVVTLFALVISVLEQRYTDRIYLDQLYQKIVSEELLNSIERFEEQYGTIPRKGNFSKITAYLETNFGLEALEASEACQVLENLDWSEYLFFWLSNYPHVMQNRQVNRNEFCIFQGGVWRDQDGDGFLELAQEAITPDFAFMLKNKYAMKIENGHARN